MADDKERPLLITVIAILYFLMGLFLILGGVLIVIGGVAVPGLALPGVALGGMLAVLGLVWLVVAGGFWNGWTAIWYIAVILGIISIIGDIALLVTGGLTGAGILGIIIQALLLYYIFRPNVKAFFGLS